MKYSYTHPETENRTSITLGNQLLRVFGVLKGLDTETDDFMDDEIATIKGFIISCHKEYLSGPKTMTLVEFVENQILIEAEQKLKSSLH